MDMHHTPATRSHNPLDLILQAEERGDFIVAYQREERTTVRGPDPYYDMYVRTARAYPNLRW